jgi:hypothetical protein
VKRGREGVIGRRDKGARGEGRERWIGVPQRSAEIRGDPGKGEEKSRADTYKGGGENISCFISVYTRRNNPR